MSDTMVLTKLLNHSFMHIALASMGNRSMWTWNWPDLSAT